MSDPLPPLSSNEVRVLGALVEKQITTPDYYPLTLNALLNACNQLTNRDPVTKLDEPEVTHAIEGLRAKRLAALFSGQESRVAKYKHTLTDALLLTPAEVALLTVLMLRGPQTLGELRSRTERLFRFDTLGEADAALQGLVERKPEALVTKLPRQPGAKEARYAHLLSGPVSTMAAVTAVPFDEPPMRPANAGTDRIAELESEVARLGRELAELHQQFEALRKQIE
jgi:uncharacterized protein YceH (UPF0502 family)